jgi:hypothetical protein
MLRILVALLASLALLSLAAPAVVAEPSAVCAGATVGGSCVGAYTVAWLKCSQDESCGLVDYVCVGIHSDHCTGVQAP